MYLLMLPNAIFKQLTEAEMINEQLSQTFVGIHNLSPHHRQNWKKILKDLIFKMSNYLNFFYMLIKSHAHAIVFSKHVYCESLEKEFVTHGATISVASAISFALCAANCTINGLSPGAMKKQNNKLTLKNTSLSGTKPSSQWCILRHCTAYVY